MMNPLVHNVTPSWQGDLNNASESDQLLNMFNMQYRLRNAVLGALGILLNLLVLPVICQNDDLPTYLKATFCCMTAGDLVAMATTVSGGFLPQYLTLDQFASMMPPITCSIFMAGNINCMVMLATAVERVLALHHPELFRRLGRSKVKVILVTPLVVLGSGVLLTLPVLVSGSLDEAARARVRVRSSKPLSTVSRGVVAVEAGIFILSSLTVCVVYSCLAITLKRRASPCGCPTAPGDPAAASSSQETGVSSASCSGTQPDLANGASASEPTSGTSSGECGHTAHTHITLRQMRRFRRATVHCAVLAVWFFIAYAPFGFYYLWVLLSGTDRVAEANTVRITVISSFPLANSLVDPLLLLWRLFPFSVLGSRLQGMALRGTDHFRELYHHARQRWAGAWSCLRTLCRRRRRNRVENLPVDPQRSILRTRGNLRTILVNGPSCSTRTIQVQAAPERKRVRLKSVPDSPGAIRKICRIDEQSEDMVV